MNMKKFWYYVLNMTWGAPMTIIGLAASLLLISFGYKPKRDKLTWYFLIPGKWGGITLGMFVIVCGETDYLLNHEFGHTLQNAVFGITMPIIGALSLLRCVSRDIKSKYGKQLEPYDSAWWEGQATRWGTNYTVDN